MDGTVVIKKAMLWTVQSIVAPLNDQTLKFNVEKMLYFFFFQTCLFYKYMFYLYCLRSKL